MASSITLYTFGHMVNADIDSADEEATGYPKENLIDNNPDTYWKGTDTSEKWLDFDLNSTTLQVDCCFVFVRNYLSLTDAESIIVYWSDNDTDYTAASGVLNIYDMTTPIAIKTTNMGVTHRYWRLKFGGVTTIPEISMVAFGKTNSITVGNQWPENDEDNFYNKIIRSDDGRDAVVGLNGRSSLEFSRTFLINGDTNYTALRAAHQDSRGSLLPLIYYDAATYRLVRFADDSFNKRQRDYQMYNPTVRFKQLPYILDGESF